jgi:sterol desaturase/sphingolipid hydroxylase (fatty acid hydroxylase superfamily)
MIRLSFALGIFLLMISWEYLKPRRRLNLARQQRWSINLGLAVINMLIMRFSIGAMGYWAATVTQQHDWGLLNFTSLPNWLEIMLAGLGLDFVIYYQHLLSHKWAWLWRLHQVHHTDLEFDASTALRFHPLEIMLSMLYKVLWIAVIGANPLAVLLFEVALNATATFNHSNIYLAPALDKKLRWFFISPDMHRIHHSILRNEMDSNYGFSISCWDRLCGTYTAEPQSPQTEMAIGLASFRKIDELSIDQLLLLPFQALRRR